MSAEDEKKQVATPTSGQPGMNPPVNGSAAQQERIQAAEAEAKTRLNLGEAILTLVILIVMVAVNAMANILPINGVGTGEVSDSYPNLFAPAGLTFAIWGVIYLLLALFVVFGFFTPSSKEAAGRLKLVRTFFIISSLANAAWIFMWHYGLLPLSLILMLIILVSLIIVSTNLAGKPLPFRERLFLRLPFSVYFGWITVATVANVTALLVDLGWDGFGLSESSWTIVILIIATLIALAVISKNRDWAYGSVVVWAYCGILIKHLDPVKGFAGQYTLVIITVSICLGFVAATTLLALVGQRIKLMPYGSVTDKPKP